MKLSHKVFNIIALGCLVLLSAVIVFRSFPDDMPVFSDVSSEKPVYVLDAGHGGEDGGAVAVDGTKESIINLELTCRLENLLNFLGEQTIMTRREDVSIHSDTANTTRGRKASDLKNRAELVNRTDGAILVSIHQNSLPTVPSVHGAQVFYGTGEESKLLAFSVQTALNQSVNQENEKTEKAIEPTIFLLNHVSCPSILIECGFLSNSAEAAALQQPQHQIQLCAAIAAGLLSSAESACGK